MKPHHVAPSSTLVDGSPGGPVRLSAALPYRYDLDGLRGIAIALVVVYHVWFGRVSGGVDIFLVLSGFFFTGMLVRRVESEAGLSGRSVLRRTGRRLLPALVVVLAATAIVTVLQRPFTQWSVIGDQLVASLFYFQNWQLAHTAADYAAADASVSPLQHLWSMSVQGQFYLVILAVIALVAWSLRRAGRVGLVRPTLILLLTVGAVASFLYAAALVQVNQPWAYYDTGARLWELLVGALLALVVHRVNLPFPVRSALAIAGFAVVLGCGFLIDGGATFPGPAALIPVGAAVALILAGTGIGRQSAVVTLLATRPFVTLGSLAYSLYLWHWPVLIFYMFWRERLSVGVLSGAGVIAVSLALAWLTQRYVEAPFTERRDVTPLLRLRVMTVLLVAAAVAIVAGAVGWNVRLAVDPEQGSRVEPLDPRTYPGAASLVPGVFAPEARMRPTLIEASADLPQPTLDGCITGLMEEDVVTCTYGDPNAVRTIAVVGSSHAEHWMPALDEIGKQRGVRIETYLKAGCPLTTDTEPMLGDVPNPGCHDWSAEILDLLRDDRPDWVFTTSTRPHPEDIGDITPPDYVDVWHRLADYGLPLMAMRDTPWLHDDGVPRSAVDCLADGGDADSCGMPRDEVLSPMNPTLDAAWDLPLVFPLDMTDAVCDVDVCRAIQGNILVYHDSHHLSGTYVRSAVPELDRQMGLATGWW